MSLKEIGLFVVDGHYFFRQGIKKFIQTTPYLYLVGETDSGEEALHQLQQLRADIVIIDIATVAYNGSNLVAQMKACTCNPKVLVLTACENETIVQKTIFEAKADGYMLKDADEHQLLNAIDRVIQNQLPLHASITRTVIIASRQKQGEAEKLTHLTKRECEVLNLIVKGERNRDIAADLHLSEGTIKLHISSILRKLDVQSRTEAAIQAINLNLVNTAV